MSGKILKSDFAQFEQIVKGLADVLVSLSSVDGKIADIKKNLGGTAGLKDVITAQKQLNELQKQQLINQKLITQNESAAAMAIKKKNEAEISGLKVLKEKTILEKNLINTQMARMRQEKLAEAQTKRTTGGFYGLMMSIKNLAMAYISLQAAFGVIRALFETTKRLDSLSFAYSKVIKSQVELGKTQEWLMDISKRYGQDLLNLSERYLKFRAATISTKLSAQETMGIFESFAKTAGVLGLKTDEVSGVFLALEQMLSKGKVTTEELRRQLGERLPGAFQIMAKTVGVTTMELDAMLKSGKILSEDVLPKFAKMVEQVYGIESVNKVNTLAAAQGRMKTSWIEFVDTLNAGGLFQSGIDKFTQVVNKLTESIGGSKINYLKSQSDEFATFMKNLDEQTFSQFEKNKDNNRKTFLEYLKNNKETANYAFQEWMKYFQNRQKLNEADIRLSTFKKDIEKKNVDELYELQKKYLDDIIKYNASGYINQAQKAREYFDIIEKLIENKTPDRAKFKESLDNSQKDFEDFSKLISKDTKAFAISESETLKLGLKGYDEYLNKLLTDEKLLREVANQPSGNLTAYRMIIEQELYKPDKGKNSALENARKKNEIELQQYRKQLEESYRAYAESTEKTLGLGEERDLLLEQRRGKMNTQMIEKEIILNNELYKIVKQGSNDYLEIKKDEAKLEADIIKETTQNKIDNINKVAKYYDDLLKEGSDNEIAKMYETVDELAIVDSKIAMDKINLAKGSGDKIEKIKDDYQEKLIDNEINGISLLLSLNDKFHFLTVDAESQMSEKLKSLRKKRNEEDFDDTEKIEKEKLRIKQQYADAGQDIINAGFDFTAQLYDNQLARAERTHTVELQSATDSVEGRMLADAKYDKKKREIEKKQAIRKKTQGVFNIIIDTAQAIMGFLKDPGGELGAAMAIGAGITGGIELGTVLSEPIPAYAKGKKGAKKGLSLMGEEGVELVEEPSGKKWLTDDKATLYNLSGGENIYPTDETQKMLAQQAFNNSFNIIGLGETNSILRSIDRKAGEQIFIMGNKKIWKHGNITTELPNK